MIELIHRFTIPETYLVLPDKRMASAAATAMLLAIGLQESEFTTRYQHQGGRARGFWQFELPGVRGVMQHQATAKYALEVLDVLHYRLKTTPSRLATDVYHAIAHNDTLACAFARLLLWTIPRPLPTATEADLAWTQYIDGWQPGRPRLDTWQHNYAEAWSRVRAAAGPDNLLIE